MYCSLFSEIIQVHKQKWSTAVFDPEVLRYLVCPLTKGALRYDADAQQLISEEISVAYPIVNGIPRLVPTAGHVIDTAEVAPSE